MVFLEIAPLGGLGGGGGGGSWRGSKKGKKWGFGQLQDKRGGGQGRQIVLKHPPGYFKKSEYTKKVTSGSPSGAFLENPNFDPFRGPPGYPPWTPRGGQKGQFPQFLQISGFFLLFFCLYFSPAALLPGLVVAT